MACITSVEIFCIWDKGVRIPYTPFLVTLLIKWVFLCHSFICITSNIARAGYDIPGGGQSVRVSSIHVPPYHNNSVDYNTVALVQLVAPLQYTSTCIVQHASYIIYMLAREPSVKAHLQYPFNIFLMFCLAKVTYDSSLILICNYSRMYFCI